MKKITLHAFAIALVMLSTKGFSQQTWVEMMQDPTVNFYTVQQEFNNYWQSHPGVAVDVSTPATGKFSDPATTPSPVIKTKKPGWKAFKRWEDYMKPRVYPSGDRMVMSAAINAYLDSVYASLGSGGIRAMGPGTGVSPLAANWTLVGPTTAIPAGGGAGRINFVRFDPTTSNTIFVGSPAGGLWKSTNSGTTWTTGADNLAIIGCTDLAIHPTNNQIMYLATGDGEAQDTYSIGVLKTTDGGTTWAPSGLTWNVTNFRTISRLLINPQNPNTLFAATSNGVYRTRNAGGSWTQIATAVANMKDIEFKPGDTTIVYACSTTGFYKSTNGGTTFVTTATGLPAAGSLSRLSIAVTAANANYVYVLASNSVYGFQGLYRSTDSGNTFTTRSTTPNVLGYSNTGGDTGGQGWYDLALAVSPLNADHVIVGGINIWRSTNGGTGWTINAHWTGSGAPYVHADIHAIEYLPGSGTTYFSGNDGGLFRTTTSGTSWTDLSNGLQIAQIYRIGNSATNSNLLLTGWQDNGTNRYNAGPWAEVLGGDGMEAIIDHSNANVQYGELYYGDIYRTQTGGNLTTNIVSSGGTGVNADGEWVTPYIMNPLKASTLLVGKGQVYRSRNRGGAWAQVGTISGGSGNLVAMAYAPTDSNYIYVAKMDKLYVSTTGTAFTDRTAGLPVASAAISYIAVASNNPQHVWVTFSGYSAANKVWYSANAGVTWTNYTTGLPNIPANCIVYHNGSTNDGLYVGTDVGVYYRDNAAASWTSYSTGLPNVVVKELEIQYAVSKLRAATFGRGVWESDLYSVGTALPVADFSTTRTNICVGDCISFTDLTFGSPTAWAWTFTGAATTTSTVQNPTGICYNTAGTYAVTLTATNVNGSNTITKTAYITVSAPVALPLVEGFESATFVPAGWALNNPDADAYTWERINGAGLGGFSTSASAVRMNNYNPPTSIVGTIDELLTPKYSFTGVSTATLTFDVAYARYDANYRDSLRVLVSTDCGATWTSVYSKGGLSGLQTAPDITTAAFVPTSTQWRTETISMTSYAGQANVMLKFQNYSGWGQMMYLDNINITGAVAPVASVTIASSDADNVICAGTSVTFTATPVNGGTTPTYQWQVNGVNVGTGGTTYTTTTLTTGQTVTCIMTSSLAGVTGSPDTSNPITMTVNAVPATPVIGSSTPDCVGQTISLTSNTITGATYSWTGPASFTSALEDPTRPSATAAMAGTYSLTVTVGGCTSAAATTTVVVNAVPAAPTAGSSSPDCVGQTISLTANTVTGATYSWTGPASFTSALEDPTRPSATAAMAGTYSVTVTVGGCTSAAGTTTVVVNPVPAAPTASSNSPVCTGGTINLTATTVAGATYSWTGPSTFTSALEDPTRPSATAAMAGTYSVTVTVGGCTSAAATTAVVINTTPAAPTAGSNSPVCVGSTINLTSTTVTGATYSWTGPSAFTSALEDPNRPSSTTAMAGTYSVTVTVGGCTSTAATTAVVVNAVPAAPVAGSSSPDCAGSTISLTASTIAGATYSWTGPASFTSALEDPTRPSATAAMAGTYSVTATVGGCTSAAGTTTVVINATPATPTATATSPVCEGANITLTTPSAGGGASYSWSGPNSYSAAVRNPPAFASSLAAAGTYSVTVTVGGCTSAPGTATVVVNPIPAAPVAGSNSPVCMGSAINLTSTTVAGATYAWTGPTGFSSTLEDPSRPSATAAMAGTYSVTVTVAGCTSPAGTTVVTVNSAIAPTVSITSGASAICSGQPVTFTASATGGGTTPAYQWQVNAVNAGTGGTSFTSSVLANGDVVTCILTSSSSCASPATATSNSIAMTVTPSVTPGITISIVGGTNPTCSGVPVTFMASTTNTGSSPSYQWQINGMNVGTNLATFTSSTMSNGDVVTCTVTSSDPCASPAAMLSSGITMTVDPTPAAAVITQSGTTLTSSAATGNQWYLDGTAIPGATGQTHEIMANGNYTVVVTDGPCSSAASNTITVIDTSIDPAAAAYGLTIYPNPNDGNFNVSFSVAERSDYIIELKNVLGQVIFRDQLADFNGTYSKALSVVEYGKGMYTISLTNSKNETVKKIIVY